MFMLKMETDNAAFDDNAKTEVCRILRRIAESLDQIEGVCEVSVAQSSLMGVVRDVNGNRVGEWQLKTR